MEFSQSYHGTPLEWSFPSPATPTNGSFSHHVYQTPKSDAYPTHFQDAFTTPHMPAHTTPQPMQYPTMTPMQRPQTSSETLRSNYYANLQAVGSQSAGPSMPPPAPMVSPTYTHAASMQLAMNTSFDSTQMQTPPPTRGTPSKKPHDMQNIAFGTPSTIASRRFMTPQQTVPSNGNVPIAQHTPMQFPQLQFSPDMYQFTNLGPASAPVVSQSRIMWAQAGSPMQPVPSTTLDDPFAPANMYSGWPVGAPQQPGPQTVSFDTPAMASFPVQPPHPRPASAVETAANTAPPIMAQASPAGVDPSLLYSSPMRPVVRSNSRTKKSRPQASSKAAGADEDMTTSHTRTATVTSVDTAASRNKPNLHRSNTTGTARPRSVHLPMSASEALSRGGSINQITRTASPVKRFGRPSLGSISESKPRQRTSVILTVDENGRARTETRRQEPSPSRSIRERYPALFDSDSSDAESDGSDQTPSRPSSFIFDKRDERRAKAARLDPPVENLEGLSILRSSSAASMKKGIPPSRAAVAAAAQLRRQGSLRRSTPSRSQNRRSVTLNSSSIDTCPMDMSSSQQQSSFGAEDPLDLENSASWSTQGDNFSAGPSSVESTLEAHNRRWSIMSFEQQQQNGQVISPQQQQGAFPSGGQYNPQQQQDYQQSSPSRIQIRCICGVPDFNSQPLIQCQSCMQWLHGACVGFHGQAIPQGFTCFLCARPSTSERRRPP